MSTQHSPEVAAGKERCWNCGAVRVSGAICERCGEGGTAPPRGSALGQGLVHGLGGVARGFGFMGKHPRLWSWIALPLVINTALCVLMAWWLATSLRDVMPDMTEAWPAWIDWLRVALDWVLVVLMWIVGVMAAFLATLLVAGIINAPFYDMLSEAVENLWLGKKDPGRPWAAFVSDLLRSVQASLSLALRYGFVMLVLLLLSFAGIGAPLFLIAGFYYTGLALADVTLSRKLYPGGQRARWGRRHWLLLLGLGVPVSLLPLLAPFGVVGATLAFLQDPDKA